MTRNELKALVKLYDKRIGTSYQLGINRYMCERLVALGMADRITKRPLTYVGKTVTVYSLSERGRKETLLTGKRFVPTLAT